MFLIIGVWEDQKEFMLHLSFLYTLLGSVLMLVAIISIYWITGTTDVTQILRLRYQKNFNIFFG